MRRRLILLAMCVLSANGAEYCLELVRPVPDRAALPEAEETRILRFEREYLEQLRQDRKVVAHGPFVNVADPRAMLIYKCDSLDVARGWVEADPAVQSRQVVADLFAWRGPNGIGEEYWKERLRDPKTRPRVLRYPVAFVSLGEVGETTPRAQLAPMLAPHAEHLRKHAKLGQVVWASPLTGGKERLDLVIFPPGSLYNAKQIAANDPAAQAKVVRYRLMEWSCEELVLPW